jgi:hypothetical protein
MAIFENTPIALGVVLQVQSNPLPTNQAFAEDLHSTVT